MAAAEAMAEAAAQALAKEQAKAPWDELDPELVRACAQRRPAAAGRLRACTRA